MFHVVLWIMQNVDLLEYCDTGQKCLVLIYMEAHLLLLRW